KNGIVKAAENAAMIPLTKETILAYVNAKATPQEVTLFLNQCAMFGLNPFKREIYLVKYKEGDPATFVVGYESYLKRADRTARWSGMESGTEDDPKTGQLIKAWAKIYRKDWTAPLYHEVFFSEYVQTKDEWQNGQKTGKKVPTRFWAEKPRTMLKKVAIAQAIRLTFPDEFSGMPYMAEEMPVEHDKLPTAEVTVNGGAPKPAPAVAHAAKRVRDEFDPEAPLPGKPLPDDTESEAAEADPLDEARRAGEPATPAGGCTMKQLGTFAALKADLACLGVKESTLYAGVYKTAGREIAEPSELDEKTMGNVIDYLHRWKKALQAENVKKDKANASK
ncbi:MAG: phage recombination protein Bet, partial [Rectinema sp.]